jgi:hypothetical protein
MFNKILVDHNITSVSVAAAAGRMQLVALIERGLMPGQLPSDGSD